ncbi:hypothetical protein SAMD00019534_125410 [Acytostelium subglobosum LB1]|uniref:hypothetical protein n=1 Tax=Acytostelium subglobosum LB1 TaxID=1410327 RepID=UPI00064523B6|nr:hypothetical protein SAMD00019534_125410 [Acytostelium subglobosum LB1]GAM29365.1 hypothetical protein SAMD00019534_125410 [Acytostelium subglobosum LB1]|eukprot:XP_012747696.1 hypothetical protein SAMD00019534_125410 [Acytostelium subglobosum LB1]
MFGNATEILLIEAEVQRGAVGGDLAEIMPATVTALQRQMLEVGQVLPGQV